MSNYTPSYIKALIQNHTIGGYHNIYLPVINIPFHTHMSNIGTIAMRPEQFLKDVSYADKKRVFEMHGFKVSHLSLTFSKAGDFMKSVNADFINGVKDYVLIQVPIDAYTVIYFVLEAPAGTVVNAKDFIDFEQVEKDKRSTARAKAFMDGVKAKDNKNLPF